MPRKNVSVGKCRSDNPAVAMRSDAFSCAMTAARCAVGVEPVANFALPPMCDASSSVSTMTRMRLAGAILPISASTASAISSGPGFTTSTPSDPTCTATLRPPAAINQTCPATCSEVAARRLGLRRLRRPLRASGRSAGTAAPPPGARSRGAYSGYSVALPPSAASSGTLCRFANMSRLSLAPGMNDGTLPRSMAISSVGAHLKKTSLAPKPSPSPPLAKPPNSARRVLARASSRKSVDRTNGSSRYNGSSTAVTSVR